MQRARYSALSLGKEIPFPAIGDAAYCKHAGGGPTHGHRQHGNGQAIMFYSCDFFFFLSFFPRLFSAFAEWMSAIAILPHVVCLSAHLQCTSEMSCTRLAENTGCKNYVKKSPSGHHRTTLSGYIFATKVCIDNRKNVLDSKYILHMFSRYGELWPTNG